MLARSQILYYPKCIFQLGYDSVISGAVSVKLLRLGGKLANQSFGKTGIRRKHTQFGREKLIPLLSGCLNVGYMASLELTKDFSRRSLLAVRVNGEAPGDFSCHLKSIYLQQHLSVLFFSGFYLPRGLVPYHTLLFTRSVSFV
jgi:hypothetical protein